MSKIKVMGTVDIILEYTDLDTVLELADYIDRNTNRNTEVDWCKTDKEDKFIISCAEVGYATYYPSNDYYEQDDWDYENLYSEDDYAEIIRNFENEHDMEFEKVIRDLEIEEI